MNQFRHNILFNKKNNDARYDASKLKERCNIISYNVFFLLMKHTLEFITPGGTSRGVLTTKDSYILKIKDKIVSRYEDVESIICNYNYKNNNVNSNAYSYGVEPTKQIITGNYLGCLRIVVNNSQNLEYVTTNMNPYLQTHNSNKMYTGTCDQYKEHGKEGISYSISFQTLDNL